MNKKNINVYTLIERAVDRGCTVDQIKKVIDESIGADWDDFSFEFAPEEDKSNEKGTFNITRIGPEGRETIPFTGTRKSVPKGWRVVENINTSKESTISDDDHSEYDDTYQYLDLLIKELEENNDHSSVGVLEAMLKYKNVDKFIDASQRWIKRERRGYI